MDEFIYLLNNVFRSVNPFFRYAMITIQSCTIQQTLHVQIQINTLCSIHSALLYKVVHGHLVSLKQKCSTKCS